MTLAPPLTAVRHWGQPDLIGASEPASGAENRKILIVDDSPTELAVMASLFQREGYDVVTSRDADDAMIQLTNERPGMILLDVLMPGTNGFSLCRQIRADVEFGKTPIILVTSKNQPSDRFWGLQQGASDYVTKPWIAADLIRVVKEHL